MEKTLAVNAGSSSLKWQLYEMPEETVIAKGIFERIGLSGSISTTKLKIFQLWLLCIILLMF